MSSEASKKIAAKIKKLRDIHNLSLQELANRVGTSKSHMWEMERGSSANPSLDMLVDLAAAFGLSLSEFVSDAGLNKPSLHPFAMKIAAMIDQELK